MATTSLFRLQALEAARVDGLGAALLSRRPADAWLAFAAAASVGLLVAVASWSPLQRRTTVQGFITEGEGSVPVALAQAATVETLLVQDGQWVAAGQPLLRLKPAAGGPTDHLRRVRAETLTQRLQLLAGEREQLAQRHHIQQRQLLAQAEHLDQALEGVAEEGELQAKRVRAAQVHQERLAELVDQGFISAAQWSAAHAQWLDERLRLAALQRAGAERRQQRQELQHQSALRQREHEQQQAQLQRAEIELQQLVLEARESMGMTLSAPRAGRVSAPHVREGATVAAGQTVLELWPSESPGAARWQAVLWVPSRAVGSVRPGQEVRLRLNAFSHRLHGAAVGRIRSVGSAPVPASTGESVPSVPGESHFRVEVELAPELRSHTGQLLALKAGMRLEADVVRERTALWQWLFEPLVPAAFWPPSDLPGTGPGRALIGRLPIDTKGEMP